MLNNVPLTTTVCPKMDQPSLGSTFVPISLPESAPDEFGVASGILNMADLFNSPIAACCLNFQ